MGHVDITRDRPDTHSLFCASLLASALVIVSVVLVVVLLALATGSGLESAFQVLIFFGFWGAVIGTPLTFLIIAPVSTAFSLAILRVMPPSPWQGALCGALMGLTLTLGFVAIIGAVPDLGTVAFFAIICIASVAAGWFVQLHVLRWPL